MNKYCLNASLDDHGTKADCLLLRPVTSVLRDTGAGVSFAGVVTGWGRRVEEPAAGVAVGENVVD